MNQETNSRSRRPLLWVVGGLVVVALLLLIPKVLPAGQQPSGTTPAAQTGTTAVADAPVLTATPVPATATVAPTPTEPPFTFAAESQIAGSDVGGLTVEEATERVAAVLNGYRRSIVLHGPGFATTYQAADLIELPTAEELVAQAQQGSAGPAQVELDVKVDQEAVRGLLTEIAPRFEQTAATEVISDAKALTQTFTFARRPGQSLDIDATTAAIEQALADPEDSDGVDLVLASSGTDPLPMAELERVLKDHATFWKGIAGFYVRNLDTGEEIAYNADTVFSGASVMKVPIMIYAYSRLGELNDQQDHWMHRMIIDSENIEANSLLAAAAGGEGTEVALQGVNEMSKMLDSLGLDHTYQLIPYESGEWLIQQALLPGGGPPHEGEAPFTAPDPYVRTTPRQMGELFVMLDECARGTGPLLEKVGNKLTKELCVEMIEWLQQPHDPERMVAGLPAGTRIAHKGGWIDDMQSDVGIVDSPGGRYVAAIYIWKDGYVTDEHATPSPYLGDFSHTIYTFFNPVPLEAK
jgi:beta-lactamase class A